MRICVMTLIAIIQYDSTRMLIFMKYNLSSFLRMMMNLELMTSFLERYTHAFLLIRVLRTE